MNRSFDSDFYKRILNRIHSNVYITDVETDEIVYMNDYMKRSFGLSDPEGQICWKVLPSGTDGRCPFCKVDELRKSGPGHVCLWREKNTMTGRVYMNHDVLEEWDGRLYHIQNSLDITDQLILSMEASIDELTGILNRSAGKKKLADMLAGMHGDDHFTVVFYDINGLKWVNDTYGHLEGDRLLTFVAQNMQKSLQSPDFVFRLSGDEFIAVLSGKEAGEAEEWAQRMLEVLDRHREEHRIAYDVSLSYGLATIYAGENLSVSDVLSIADTQMYIQKRDHHLLMGRKPLRRHAAPSFHYNRDYFFEAVAESVDDYLFTGDLKTGAFRYSQKLVLDFGLPGDVVADAASFWAEKVHPDDRDRFLRANREVAEGRAEKHAVTYRAVDRNGEWVHLLCRGRMIRDPDGQPAVFAGIIRNLDRPVPGARRSLEELDQFLSAAFWDDFLAKPQSLPAAAASQEPPEAPPRSFYFLQEIQGGERLKTELRLLNFVNRNIPGGILAVYDEPEYPIFCFNQAILEYTGYRYEELLAATGGHFAKLMHPDDRRMVGEEITKQLAARGTYELRYRLLRKSDGVIWVYERGRYVAAEDGRPLILSFFVDISHEMESEQELRFIADNSAGGIFKVENRDGFPLLYASDGFYRLHGYTREQMAAELDNCAERLILPEDSRRIRKQANILIQKGFQQAEMEYRARRRDGSLIWIHTSASLAILASGKQAFMGVLMDITGRRELEERLLRTEQLYRIAQKYSRLNMWEYDIENRRILRAEGTQKLGAPMQTIEDVPESLIRGGYIHPESVGALRDLYSRAAAGEQGAHADIRVRSREEEGGYLWARILFTAIRSIDGRPVWAVGVSEDITAQKKAELQAFQEEAMRGLLAKELLFSFRLNLTRDTLEEILRYDGQPVRAEAAGGYEELSRRILRRIASEDDRKRFSTQYTREKVEEWLRDGGTVPDFEFKLKRDDGRVVWAILNLRELPAPGSGDRILFGYARDIDRHKKQEMALQRKAESDEASGLYNQDTFRLIAQNIMRKEARHPGVMALQLLDIDNFTDVHLTGGLPAAEDAVRLIGDEIRKAVPPTCFAGRLNGDIFLLFYYDMESEQETLLAAERVRQAVCRSYRIGRAAVALTASSGIAGRSPGMRYDELYQRALYALGAAKKSGKDRLVPYREAELSAPSSDPDSPVYAGTVSNAEFYALLGECWAGAEQGGGQTGELLAYLEQLGRFYHAGSVLLLRRRNPGEALSPGLMWRADDTAESSGGPQGELACLEAALQAAFPETCMLVEDARSPGYGALRSCYGGEPPLPVMASGIYEGGQLISCLLLERVGRQSPPFRALKAVAGFIRRTQNLHALQQDYRYAVSHDHKTGLLNYDSYLRYLDAANEDLFSAFGMVGVHIADLRDFNYRFGARKGDELLLFTAGLLSEIFGAENCYRMSGAGFLVLCPDITYDAFAARCGQLQKRLEEAYPGWTVCCHAWEQYAISVEKMQQQLEEKQQVALNSLTGGSRAAGSKTADEILADIREAIAKGSFRTFLQPKAEAATGRVCGAEALIRYQDEKYGVVPPGRFLPGIERAGLIRHIDLFVLEDVCRILKSWMGKGWTPFPISLNYSRATILEPGILEETNRIVERYGIAKELIEIEVTESISSIDSVSLQDIVSRFVKAGYHMALDDFGAEYSNIYVLYSLDIHSLKLERRIVGDVYHDGRARMVVESLIGICKRLGIACVAEGVETAEQFEALREMGCALIQGYYLNKPLSEKDFETQYIFPQQ